MIGRLTGVVAECRPDHVVLDVGGVGYHLQIPLSTYYALCAEVRPSRTLHVHLHVREDALQMFGFATPEEKITFESLIAISGIGPRVGLAFLSGIGVEELRQSVLREDRARLEKIPGVGRKTAERVLLELRDRYAGATRGKRSRGRPIEEPPAAPGGPRRVELREDAVSALANLGYTRDAAGGAVDRVLAGAAEEPSLEDLLRQALSRLAG